ncbi:hypothetical protein F0Q45_21750 [Mycobacterium simiae]|uniref:Uncharacterized protein n=1 Tax=Mycobacterium simiae TaxID=1784 RepID=A0A5B1BLB3_MYCSI|nr:hypothetical protein [Mycobacterium simiae]KAA1248223.1 hypothetical protein F0Q45_21750 [Mycobacterium simiae]
MNTDQDSKDALLWRVKTAMSQMAPEELTVDELRPIAVILEASIGREYLRRTYSKIPYDVIRLDNERTRRRAVAPGR